MRVIFLTVSLLGLCEGLSPLSAQAHSFAPASWSFYLSESVGSMSVEPENKELKKSGVSFLTNAGVRRHWGRLNAHAAVGVRVISLESEGESRDVYSEAINAVAMSSELGLGINFFSWIQPSIAMRMAYGPNTVIAPEADEKNTVVSSAVAALDFPFAIGRLNVLPGAFYEQSVGLKERKISTVGFSIALEFPKPERPYLYEAEERIEEVDDTEHEVLLTLDPKSLTKDHLRKIARFLVDNDVLWKTLLIGDHAAAEATNASDESESLNRAESLRKTMIAAGVPAERVSAAGYATSKPLAGLVATDPKNQRIELLFKGVKKPTLIINGLKY